MQILSRTNQPFATEQAAKIQASRLKLQGSTIVAVEGGYAIETEETPAMESAQLTETVSEVTTSENPAPKRKHAVTTPWKPASYLGIPKHLQVPGRRYRFCKTDRPGNIDKKIAEGWVVDKELTRQMARLNTPTIMDGKPLDTTLQVREMIVMWMPEEMAEARNKYYRDRSVAAQKGAKSQFKQETRGISGDGSSYGEIETN